MSDQNQVEKGRVGKVLRWSLIILAVLVVVVAAGLISFNRYLNSTRVRERIQAATGSQIGSKVEIGDLRVSIWRGFSLRDVTVASVLPGFASPLAIPEINLKYRLTDLIKRRLTISEVVIRNPVLILNRKEHDAPPDPGTGADKRPFLPRQRRVELSASAVGSQAPGSSAWTLAVDSFRLVNLRVEINLGPPFDLVQLEGIDLDACLNGVVDKLEAKGSLKLGRASSRGIPFLQDLRLDFGLKENRLDIGSIRANLLDGELKGRIAVTPSGAKEVESVSLGVEADLALVGIKPATFLKEGLEMDLLAGGEINAFFEARGDLPWPEARLDISFSGLKSQSGLEVDKGGMEIRHSGGDIRAEKIRIALWDGEITGELSASIPVSSRPLSLSGKLDIKDLEVERLFHQVGSKDPVPFGGKVEGEIRLSGNLHPKENILPRVEGRLSSRRLMVEKIGAVEDIHIPLDLRDNRFQSRGLRASVGGGRVSGDIQADLRDPTKIPYQGELKFADVDLARLQATLEKPPEIKLTGRAGGRAAFSGLAGPIENLKSEGWAELKQGSITGHPTQKTVAALTGIKRLEQIDLNPAELKFRVSDGILEIRDAVIHADQVRIDTSGRVRLAPSRDLDFKVRLNFHNQLVEEFSPHELRLALKPAFPGDEFRGIEFRLWGSPEDIKSDYLQVLMKNAATGFLERELFRRDRD